MAKLRDHNEDDGAGDGVAGERRRGRGATSNRSGRFEVEAHEPFDDGWQSAQSLAPFATEVQLERARRIVTYNQSPDIAFDRSINPYRGCEHGCIYCYARPSHCFLGLSAGLDFETKLFAKPDAAALLRRELAAPGYQPQAIALGANTDPYQPIERGHRLTRQILEILAQTRHPVIVVTKSALVERDIDILAEMAAQGLAGVAISITTLDRGLARRMEPRASTPAKRLGALEALARAGVPTTVLVAPVIPALNDSEIEDILASAADAGARSANFILIRLPLEVRDLFRDWLREAFPDRAAKVMSLIRSTRGGADYETDWHVRQRGRGAYAAQIEARFKLARGRFGLAGESLELRTDLFRKPPTERARDAGQLDLFGQKQRS